MIFFAFRLLVAVIFWGASQRYFSLVLADPLPSFIGWGLGLTELFGPMFLTRTSGKGFGGAISALATFATVAAGLLLWPSFAWAIAHVAGVQSKALAAACGAIPAVAVGMVAAGHGQGHEHRRLAVVLVSAALALMALVEALPAGRAATGAAGLAVVAALYVARAGGVWPPGHVRALDAVAIAIGFAACANGVMAIFSH